MESEMAQTGQCVVRNEPGCQVCQTNFESENPRRRLRSEPRAARPLRSFTPITICLIFIRATSQQDGPRTAAP